MVSREKEIVNNEMGRIMKKYLTLCFLLISCAINSHAEEILNHTPIKATINYGFKAGFTSTLFLVSDFQFGETQIEEVQNNYKIGYFASLFMRINFDRHFIQPEFSYGIDRSNLTFDKSSIGTDVTPKGTKASIESTIHNLEMPIIYGYNIIKEEPYSMALFGVPKFRYILTGPSNIKFTNINLNHIVETIHRLNLSFTFGVSVAISRIFFDFRYDIGLHNLSKHGAYESEGTVSPISFKRRDNVLSFSLGVIF